MPIVDLHDPRFSQTLQLVEAARQQRLDEVRTLLNAGAPADGVIYQRYNAMHYAAEHGHVELAQALFDAGAVGFDPVMIRAEPALHRAVLFQRDAFALWLLDQPDPSFDPNRRNADGFTALHLLALHPAVPMNVVERLLHLGADPRLTTPVRYVPPEDSDLTVAADSLPAAPEIDLYQRPRDALDIARSMDAQVLLARLEHWVFQQPGSVPDPVTASSTRPRL